MFTKKDIAEKAGFCAACIIIMLIGALIFNTEVPAFPQ